MPDLQAIGETILPQQQSYLDLWTWNANFGISLIPLRCCAQSSLKGILDGKLEKSCQNWKRWQKRQPSFSRNRQLDQQPVIEKLIKRLTAKWISLRPIRHPLLRKTYQRTKPRLLDANI
jgi:hypothetical protein